MIVCSCNVLSDHQVRSAVAKATRPPRMSQVYGGLGSSPQCGRCARTIKRIMDGISGHAIGPVTAGANLRKRAAES
jgi:bacterioferritin-associated ferredoxin